MTDIRAPRTILITGATGAIGGALAEVYAAEGITLILQGRNTGRLAGLAAVCKAKGARVLTNAINARDLESYAQWLSELSDGHAIDLLFVNAGVNSNIGEHGDGECWENVRELIEVNVLAAMATVDRVLPSMRARKRGQIVLISSLAAYFGLPITPSYCASKAALKAYGEALRGWLVGDGIRVNVVMPGYVDSAMCRAMPGPKPFLWTADRAARYIRRGLLRDKPRISFPFPLNIGTWLLAVMPPSLSQRILRLLNYGG